MKQVTIQKLVPPTLIIAVVVLVSACAPPSKVVLLKDSPLAPNLEEPWRKYGAYYVVDETVAEGYPMDRITVNKKLKILTLEGAAHGAVEVPLYSTSPYNKANLTLIDSSGQTVKLDTGSILRAYRSTGKILFPKVVPGSILEVNLVFYRDEGSIPSFEHWFSGALPVAHGRLTFSGGRYSQYDFAKYGNPVRVNTVRDKPNENVIDRTWEVFNVYPRSRLDFQEEIGLVEPRVSAVLRKAGEMVVFTNWSTLSERYQEAALKPSFFNSSMKLRKRVDELIQGKTSDLEKAKTVFEWVTDNISFKPGELDVINCDKVISSGQGNLWEITVVLREMFKHLKLKTDIVVTRPRSAGGFDPKFATPIQLAVPLITVTVGEDQYLAFPFSQGGALGEYPNDYFDLSALSLEKKDASLLPEFASGPCYSHFDYRISASQPEAEQQVDMEFGGYKAFQIRNGLLREEKKEVTELFQKILTEMGTSNSLRSCKVTGQKTRGKPLNAQITLVNPGQSVERKGEMYMKLSHLFTTSFATYDTSRSAGFTNRLENESRESVTVAKVAGKKLELVIPCLESSNALFKLSCRSEESKNQLVFTRQITFRKVSLSAIEMRKLFPQIEELNRIREAHLTLRDET